MKVSDYLPKDKLLHAAFGALTAVSVVGLVYVVVYFGAPLAMWAGATALGGGYELQQRLRGDGEPDWKDALATSVGGGLIALGAHFLGL
jgi:hypothetical protein